MKLRCDKCGLVVERDHSAAFGPHEGGTHLALARTPTEYITDVCGTWREVPAPAPSPSPDVCGVCGREKWVLGKDALSLAVCIQGTGAAMLPGDTTDCLRLGYARLTAERDAERESHAATRAERDLMLRGLEHALTHRPADATCCAVEEPHKWNM